MADLNIDLTNCDKEPIHILGKIQSHGFMVAVEFSSGLINYVSENINSHIEGQPKSLLGNDLEFLCIALKLNKSGSQFLLSQLTSTGTTSKSIELFNPYYVELTGQPYNIILSATVEHLIVEFEVLIKDEFNASKVIGTSLSKILSGTTLSSILVNAAREIKNIISYDRVMIYQFSEEGHGEVIAEEKDTTLEPFLNPHYPASDIPKQARELYKINLTRIIADVNSEPSLIITNEADGKSLDLTHVELRAVSPIHIQYLKNMGVQSSFSISLLSKGELWGLVACHNYTPKFINFNARSAAKLIGQILSSAIEFRQHEENSSRFELLNSASSELIKMIDDSGNIADSLTKNNVTLLDITDASGAAFVFEKKITSLGITPGPTQIFAIADWIFEHTQEIIFSTHRFPKVYEPALKFSGIASGVLACILSKELKEIIIWFKPEILENIHWAGNPEKPVEIDQNGLAALSPRKSFESWTETVRHTSAKWSNAEVTSVVKIREHIIYAIKRKANEIRLLNEKLVLAYEELDTFSYTVSHDLRTPLSSIKGYSELLLTNESLDENAKKILERIRKCTDKMAQLITEILSYSHIGQNKIERQVLDMATIIAEVRYQVIESENLDLEFILGDTPSVLGDKVMIKQVFSNLIGNSVKYSLNASPAKITVKGEVTKKEVIYSIEDNGIGIDVNYYNKVFELFQRMDNVQHLEGNGVGLAIVKRIVEKHSGRIWFESKLGEGTTFYIAFPKI